MTQTLSCHITLPPAFRRSDILRFHRRDPEQLSERVESTTLHKGLLWQGLPACLSIRFGQRRASVKLAIDGMPSGTYEESKHSLRCMARRMLGLTQDVDSFERTHRDHPRLGGLIAANPGLRVPLTATPFEAASWAIIGQQISVSAAVSVRRRFIHAAGLPHSSGLWCYPDPGRIARMDEALLRPAGLSATKARSMVALSDRISRGELPLDDWADAPPVAEIRERLLGIRGIGPWTVDYTLLRGFGWLDGSLHGDVAVRRNLQRLLEAEEAIPEKTAQAWLADFSPWRALVAAHLWAMPR